MRKWHVFFDTDHADFPGSDRWYGLTLRLRGDEPGFAIVLSWGTWEGALVIDQEGK